SSRRHRLRHPQRPGLIFFASIGGFSHITSSLSHAVTLCKNGRLLRCHDASAWLYFLSGNVLERKESHVMTQIVYTTGLVNSPYPVLHRSNWRINANGSVGTLTLQSTDNLTLTGSVIFDDAPREDMIQGGWDDVGRRISFTRTIPDGTLQF